MSELSKINGHGGPPHTVTHEGKTYPLRHIDRAGRDEFAKHLFALDREAAKMLGGVLSEEKLAAKLEAMGNDWRLGRYSIYSPRGQEFVGSTAGQLWLVCRVFGCDEDEAVRLLTECPDAAPMLRLVIEESLPRAPKKKAGADDPNAPGPAT